MAVVISVTRGGSQVRVPVTRGGCHREARVGYTSHLIDGVIAYNHVDYLHGRSYNHVDYLLGRSYNHVDYLHGRSRDHV